MADRVLIASGILGPGLTALMQAAERKTIPLVEYKVFTFDNYHVAISDIGFCIGVLAGSATLFLIAKKVFNYRKDNNNTL